MTLAYKYRQRLTYAQDLIWEHEHIPKTKHVYLRWCCTEKVKAVVISFRIWNLANTRSFEQISSYGCPRYPPTLVKLDLNKFTKTTALWYQGEHKEYKLLRTSWTQTTNIHEQLCTITQLGQCFKIISSAEYHQNSNRPASENDWIMNWPSIHLIQPPTFSPSTVSGKKRLVGGGGKTDVYRLFYLSLTLISHTNVMKCTSDFALSFNIFYFIIIVFLVIQLSTSFARK